MMGNGSGRRAAGYGVALALATALVLAGCAELSRQLDSEGARVAAPAGAARAGEDAARAAAEAAPAEEAVPARPESERIEGSGAFVASPAQVIGAGPGAQVGDITLNFVNADVREVVRSVLGDTLGENYILDPRVQGTITVQTSRPLPRGALVPMLEEILGLNGFALVRKPDNYVVLPLQEAINTAGVSGPFLPGGGVTRGFAIRILPLAHVSAREMAAILEPLTPAGGVLRVDAARNLLVIAGTQNELQALQELVAIFDVDWLAGTSFTLVPLDVADAETVVGELQTIFGTDDGPLAGLLRFVAVKRINAVLVIAGRAGNLDQAESWIARLDKGEGEGEGAARRLFVYYVKNGRAEALAEVLSEVFAPARREEVPQARLAPGAERVEVGAAVRTIGAPTAEDVERLRAERRERMAEAEPEAAPAAEAEPAGAVARGAEGAGPGIGVVAEGDIRIIADEANNALVILATAREYRMIEAAISKLDIVPLQVLIEATIAEVTLTDALRYGVQWFIQEGNSAFTLSEVATGDAAQVFPGFSYLLTGGMNFRLVLNALDSITDVNVISSPQLMVLDNQTAELQVGADVPVATGTQQEAITTGTTVLASTIEFRETGIILRVTPRVNPGGLVIMEIEQEVSSVVDTVATTTPTIQQRRIHSSVAIQSGETVALGGLIQDNRNRTKSGVPFLQDIPLLGELFSTTSDTDTRTELLVVITPRVVGNQEEARAVTDELRRKMRAVTPLGARIEGD